VLNHGSPCLRRDLPGRHYVIIGGGPRPCLPPATRLSGQRGTAAGHSTRPAPSATGGACYLTWSATWSVHLVLDEPAHANPAEGRGANGRGPSPAVLVMRTVNPATVKVS